MQAGVLKDKGKPFVMALTNGKFPVEELEKFANGQPSMVDKFAGGAVEPGEAEPGGQVARALPPKLGDEPLHVMMADDQRMHIRLTILADP